MKDQCSPYRRPIQEGSESAPTQHIRVASWLHGCAARYRVDVDEAFEPAQLSCGAAPISVSNSTIPRWQPAWRVAEARGFVQPCSGPPSDIIASIEDHASVRLPSEQGAWIDSALEHRFDGDCSVTVDDFQHTRRGDPQNESARL
eukprot:3175770-Prymnesium_polylepis.2